MDSMNISLHKLQETVKDREAWCAAVYGVTKSRTWLCDWTTSSQLYPQPHCRDLKPSSQRGTWIERFSGFPEPGGFTYRSWASFSSAEPCISLQGILYLLLIRVSPDFILLCILLIYVISNGGMLRCSKKYQEGWFTLRKTDGKYNLGKWADFSDRWKGLEIAI